MPVPVINLAQMREWERATWAAGQTEAEVIRRVGEKIAERALQLTRSGDAILILAGKGHNGDDARAARKHLRDRRVEVLDGDRSKNGAAGMPAQDGANEFNGKFVRHVNQVEQHTVALFDLGGIIDEQLRQFVVTRIGHKIWEA